ncbi:hypothetical protein [Rhodococcus jostii]|uniref:hypothetical protein n=1 Tax=Rhodococcus jostii TaxID=132919 RepID=UPI0036277516
MSATSQMQKARAGIVQGRAAAAELIADPAVTAVADDNVTTPTPIVADAQWRDEGYEHLDACFIFQDWTRRQSVGAFGYGCLHADAEGLTYVRSVHSGRFRLRLEGRRPSGKTVNYALAPGQWLDLPPWQRVTITDVELLPRLTTRW